MLILGENGCEEFKAKKRSKYYPMTLPLGCPMVWAKPLHPGFPSFCLTHDSPTDA